MNNVESALMKEAALASNATTFNSTLSENNMTLYTTTEAPTTFTTSATTSIVNGTLGLVNGTLSLVNDTLSSVNDTFAALNATVDEALSVDGGFYFDHTFYVYIWAVAIFCCIVFTSGRFVAFVSFTLIKLVVKCGKRNHLFTCTESNTFENNRNLELRLVT